MPYEAKESLKKTEFNQYNESLLNYLENNLSAQEKLAMEQKINSEPLLSAEWELYKKTILVPDEQISFDSKSILAKTENDLVRTEAFKLVAFSENGMTAGERLDFEKELTQGAALRKELDLVLKTFQKADLTIVFPNKEQLKKKNRVFALYSTKNLMRMAAAILLLLSFSFLVSYYGGKEPVKLAQAGVTKADNILTAPSKTEVVITKSKKLISKAATQQRAGASQLPKSSTVHPIENVLNTSVGDETPQIATTHTAENEVQNNLMLVPQPQVEKTLTALSPAKQKVQVGDSINTTQFYLLALEEDEDSRMDAEEKPLNARGFWQKAVVFAQQVNKFGFKSVEGVEAPHQKFRLAINNFSVEKR
ncbi:MAG: hypothetical protein PSX36_00500 [bacterium]|nr:hypothetical protein [bacterium]